VPEIGATGSVVARLSGCIELLEQQNYRLYMDRFYNSPRLCDYLQVRKLHACSTVQTNRKEFPRQLVRSKKLFPRGQSDFLCRENGTSATVWCDRNPVYFLSTCHDPQLVSSVSRRNKDGTVVQIPCPQLVKEYTAAMGGCDLNDQMTPLYRSRRNYKKTIIKLVFFSSIQKHIDLLK